MHSLCHFGNFFVKIMCFHKILPHDVTRHHFGTTSLFKISMLCAQDLEFVISDRHTLLHDFGSKNVTATYLVLAKVNFQSAT